ncbi:unnamed protein product [Pleuronectes platessa]|uniref:Uncharacterized protein n=1 Tax=Pleuronectes platessa TaxID=8262 RepID=A0A9N7V816_PLEPL|nr:unnamed protein product [Pleuronectes platessa]
MTTRPLRISGHYPEGSASGLWGRLPAHSLCLSPHIRQKQQIYDPSCQVETDEWRQTGGDRQVETTGGDRQVETAGNIKEDMTASLKHRDFKMKEKQRIMGNNRFKTKFIARTQSPTELITLWGDW